MAAYALAGYALAMLLNVFVPHVLATLALRQYAPGTATALLFNLPVCGALLYVGIKDGYIVTDQLVGMDQRVLQSFWQAYQYCSSLAEKEVGIPANPLRLTLNFNVRFSKFAPQVLITMQNLPGNYRNQH